MARLPFEVNVGPAVITINRGSTFMVTAPDGGIREEREDGVFASDTRFVSHYELTVNGVPWVLLSSAATSYDRAQTFLTNASFPTEGGIIPQGTLTLALTRTVDEGIHEDIDIAHHGVTPVRFTLEITLGSDFTDIFEVRSHRFVRRGHLESRWRPEQAELVARYRNGDFDASVAYRLLASDSPPDFANGRIVFDIDLAPGGAWHTCAVYLLALGERRWEPRHGCRRVPPSPEAEREAWRAATTRLDSSNEHVYRLFRQSVEDMEALRLPTDDGSPESFVPAAGVPWYVTVFGRDAIITSLQNTILSNRFPLGTLHTLGALQADRLDPWRDAEPGKIPHEIRFGELAHLHRIPHTPYYGTADATPLYLVLLHETWRWLGDEGVLKRHLDTALRCLEWIDRYGDRDGDGLQEYATRSPMGYENMGWKDSADGVLHPDGTPVKGPKALCELQGYVFDAWLRMAEAFRALGREDEARALEDKARQLKALVEEQFWCEEIGTYAFCLDGDKRPVLTVTSNPGHLLWSGLPSQERAGRVVARLLAPDMWSGWGVRTLSSSHLAYNPLSYHRGSVWPHDNGLIALGMKRYGYVAAAQQVARGISGAAAYFVSYRLPELFAGLPQEETTFPVQYLGANVPQSWAAGSVFHLLQAILGLQADAPRGRLAVDPSLPPWLQEVRLHGLSTGDARLDLVFRRLPDGRTAWEADVRSGHIEVVEEAWRPWFVEETTP
jgi:glycogen debranching enzyme